MPYVIGLLVVLGLPLLLSVATVARRTPPTPDYRCVSCGSRACRYRLTLDDITTGRSGHRHYCESCYATVACLTCATCDLRPLLVPHAAPNNHG